MINKMVTREIGKLKDKIEELEIENKRIIQVSKFRKRQTEDLEAELTYWKETAEYWKNAAHEFDATTKI